MRSFVAAQPRWDLALVGAGFAAVTALAIWLAFLLTTSFVARSDPVKRASVL